jgi:glycosyltransferase involved in cell wall biosynthesis
MAPRSRPPKRRHAVFVQYGDYREAVQRFGEGGPETYVAQRYSVSHVASLSQRMDVTVVCLPAEPHDELLPNGVRAVGLGHDPSRQDPRLIRALERLKPTDVILATPHLPALTWCVVRGLRVLPLLADSFRTDGLRARARTRFLARLLSHPRIPFVANHNRPAALDLVRIGVPAEKVLPWDWPPQHTPDEHAPREAPPEGNPFRLFYVGSILTTKGVGDAIRAQRILVDQRVPTELSIGGSGGELESMRALARAEGVAARVRFLGRVENASVIPTMRAHDVVLVPSQHAYPEGLPMTIYEALCAQTPLIVSDHPMFLRALRDGEDALVFRAGDPAALAARVKDLRTNPELYARLSRHSRAAWERIQVPLRWGDLVDRWLSDTEEDRAFLREMTLAADTSTRIRVSASPA